MLYYLKRAPSTSARWYPKVMYLVGGFFPIQSARSDIKNPIKSENKWAASVMIAKLPAKYPPSNSAA